MSHLDVDLLLAKGSIAGPYTRPKPVTRTYRVGRRFCRSLGRFLRALRAFLTTTRIKL